MRDVCSIAGVALLAALLGAGACTLDATGTRSSEHAAWTSPGAGGATTTTTTGQGGATTTDPTTSTSTTGSTTTTTITAAGGAGGAGGSGGVGGAGGTTTTTPVAEDCTNGLDDDGDGAADCADAECEAGFVCVPAPAGVTQVAFLGARAVASPPNGCGPMASAPALFTSLDVPIDGCACACGETVGGVCTLADWASFWPSQVCSGNGWSHNADACLPLSGKGAVQSVQAQKTWVGQAPSCTPGVQGTPKPATFATAVDRCLAPTSNGGGCGPGNACVPRPPAGLSTSACVEVAVGSGCPGGLPHARTLYEGVNDSRACASGTCGCGAFQNAACSVSYELFADGACATVALASVPMDGACHVTGLAAGAVGSAKYATTFTGSCAPSGQPATTGQAVGTGAHTLCCQTP